MQPSDTNQMSCTGAIRMFILGSFSIFVSPPLALASDTHPPLPVYPPHRGAGIPLNDLLRYLTTATTFQALMLMLIRKFGKLVITDYALAPFSRKP